MDEPIETTPLHANTPPPPGLPESIAAKEKVFEIWDCKDVGLAFWVKGVRHGHPYKSEGISRQLAFAHVVNVFLKKVVKNEV